VPARACAEPFDAIAADYDRIFTETAIGRAQRAQVTRELNRCFVAGEHVLELNCGTGEDALALERRGVRVTALDASAAMIEAANARLQLEQSTALVRFSVLRNEELGSLDGSFDGAFSNFSGLNCSEDWGAIAGELRRLVRPGGHLLLCIMGRACLWEMAAALLGGSARRAFRRMARSADARIGDRTVRIFYRSVRDARRAFSAGFTLQSWKGVGTFVPPSKFEPLVQGHPGLLRSLSALDFRFAQCPGLRMWADHFLLHFVRTNA
jgi:ubiquinone/menaquinone biosynthesis C-methylase UbiE